MVSSGKEEYNMMPIGGFSLVFHLAIVLYFNHIKEHPMKVVSLIFIFLVVGLVSANGGFTLKKAMEEGNNIQIIKEARHVCIPVVQEPSERVIFLRVDDIQAYAYSEISKKMIEDAAKNNMRLILGVIPNKFSEDKDINKTIEENICNLELAIHGWDHGAYQKGEEYEFENISEEDARMKIKEGEAELGKFSKEKIVTFIPPGNKISEGAANVLEEEGVVYLSADNASSEYGMNATTYDFIENKLIDNQEIFDRCNANFKSNKSCVIVLHPQDYLTDDLFDQNKYAQYINLLEEFRRMGVVSKTFNEL